MFRKNYFIYVLIVVAILIGSTAVFAQNATISGRVQMDDNGKKGPAPNVLVEAYRTDTKKVEPVSAKTDEKGEFKLENLPSGKEFALAVSGENLEASVVTDIKSDATNVEVTLKPGNGSQPSATMVRQTLLASGKLKLSAEEIAEEEKAAKAIEESNAKAKDFNAKINRALEEGVKADKDKNYDVAIAKYEEGYQAGPTFLGSAPTFLNAKGLALRERAVDYFNKSVTSGDDKEAKTANAAKSAKDFSDAIDAYHTSWMLLKNATEAQKTEVQNYSGKKMETLSEARSLLYYAVRTGKADSSKIDKVKELLGEYINLETDKMKKAEANTVLAGYYRVSGDFDTAIAEYRKALAISSDEPGALFGLGISLVSTGYNDDGSVKKPQLQEAANLLKRFTDSSPTDKKDLKDANETLQFLKDANITPKK
jgi:tetratricopeptide (TPR) repeat protein